MIVKVIDKVKNYEEAIKLSCDELVKNGSIEDRYYDAILSKIEEFGAYFCIADHIAMPHARPEDGALKTDLCVLKLNKEVDFLGKPIKIFFTITAVDSSSHIDTIKNLAEICMNKEKVEKILNSKNEKEIMEVM